MWFLFFWLWIIGGAGAAVLFEVARADSARIATTGRAVFAVWVSLLLLGVAVAFASQNELPGRSVSSRSGWWVVVVLAGVPLMAVCAIAMRKVYRGRRAWLFGGLLLAAVLYVLYPLGYVPPGHPLNRLGRFEHLHHVLDVVALSLPALVLLAAELKRGPREPEPAP